MGYSLRRNVTVDTAGRGTRCFILLPGMKDRSMVPHTAAEILGIVKPQVKRRD